MPLPSALVVIWTLAVAVAVSVSAKPSHRDDFEYRNGMKIEAAKWPNATMPYYVTDPALHQYRDVFRKAASVWSDNTCVNIYELETKPSTEPENLAFPYMQITSNPQGVCKAEGEAGYQPGIPTGLSLSKGCIEFVGKLIHEMGHVLGLFHEQQRPDRDRYLIVFDKNFAPGPEYAEQFAIVPQIDTFDLPYDYESIMQYPAWAFSGPTPGVVTNRLTMVPRDPLAFGLMNNRRMATFQDVQVLNLVYHCTDKCKDVACANSGYAYLNRKSGCTCNCPDGWEGKDCTEKGKERECYETVTSAPHTIRSMNFPGKMPESAGCSWLIKPEAGKKIQVHFTTFVMKPLHPRLNACANDQFRVRTGDLLSDDPGKIYCGMDLAGQTITYEGDTLLTLMSDLVVWPERKLEAEITFV